MTSHRNPGNVRRTGCTGDRADRADHEGEQDTEEEARQKCRVPSTVS